MEVEGWVGWVGGGEAEGRRRRRAAAARFLGTFLARRFFFFRILPRRVTLTDPVPEPDSDTPPRTAA